MSGYVWARTAAGELLIVLLVDGMGYVPAREDAIDLFQIEFLGPVQWPTAITQPSRSSAALSLGALVAVAMRGVDTPPYVANA
jgi:hypothetical protein